MLRKSLLLAAAAGAFVAGPAFAHFQSIYTPDAVLDAPATIPLDLIFWHPLSTDADMQVSKRMFPLATAVVRIQRQLETIARTGGVPLMEFK